MTSVIRTAVALALSVLFLSISADPAQALLDIPTSDRRALQIADLAGSSGVARPADLAVMPLDDSVFLESYQSLNNRGLDDQLGAQVASWAETRADGRFHFEFLRPDLDVRTYWAGADTDGRLLYHTSGDRLESGLNTFTSLSGEAFWGERLAGHYELQGVVRSGDLEYRTKRLYLKGVWGKWSLKVGRDSERLGPGYRGSLLLDDNAPTMDMLRVRTEAPLFLPGKLASLGGFRFMVLNAFLSDDNPSPPDPRYGSGVDATQDPFLLAMRFSYHPTSWMDLGLSRAILYGGRGRETYDSPHDYWELFTATNENVFEGESDQYDNDQYATMDATVRLPVLNGFGPFKGGKVYLESGGTDLHASWQGDDTALMPFRLSRKSYLVGGYLTTAVTDFRVEYADTHDAWYRHSQYPQGYSFQGRPLGHSMGGDALSWYFEIGRHFGPDWRLSGAFDYEERGRSLERTETRKEGTLWLENRTLEIWGRPLSVRADYLLAEVEDPLDDLEASDRTETYLGVTVRFPL